MNMTAQDYSQLVVFNYGKLRVLMSLPCTSVSREGSIVTVLFSKFSTKADHDDVIICSSRRMIAMKEDPMLMFLLASIMKDNQ